MDKPNEAAGTAPLERSKTALLNTFRSNGVGVSTPVSVSSDAGRIYFVTSATSGKAKRLAQDSRVTLAPCTVSGNPLGDAVEGQALLIGHGARRALRLLRPTRTLFWSFLLYRLQGNKMDLYEVHLAPGPG